MRMNRIKTRWEKSMSILIGLLFFSTSISAQIEKNSDHHIENICHDDQLYNPVDSMKISTPLHFEILSASDSYLEGETVELILIVKNTSDQDYPFIRQKSRYAQTKTLCLEILDRAENVSISRAKERYDSSRADFDLNSFDIYWLKPNEEFKTSILWNDTLNKNSHTFGHPIFAGVYRIKVLYKTKQIFSKEQFRQSGDLTMEDFINHENQLAGIQVVSNSTPLKIRKAPEGKIEIEGRGYVNVFSQEHERFYYYLDSISPENRVNQNIFRFSNIPSGKYEVDNDACEYTYTQYSDNNREYIVRFKNGDINLFSNYRNMCPSYINSVTFDEFGTKLFYGKRLSDGRYYTIYYHTNGTIREENYYSKDANALTKTEYFYAGKLKLPKKKITVIENPCADLLELAE